MPYRKLPTVLPKKLREKGITLGEIRRKTNSIIESDRYQLKLGKAQGFQSAEPFAELIDKLKKLNERIKNEKNLFKKKMFNSELTRTKIDVNLLNFQSTIYFYITFGAEKKLVSTKMFAEIEHNSDQIRNNLNHCMESGVMSESKIYNLSKDLVNRISKAKFTDFNEVNEYLKKKVWETELLKKIN
ncbi:MAG: hypothetical protein WCF78_03595 [archaeon]